MPLLLLALLACDDKTPPDDSAPEDSTPPAEAWAWCPGADAYVGEASWPGEATARGALYCSLPNEDRALADEVAAKAMLRVVDGDYPLPVVDGSYTLGFPVCTLRAEGQGPDAAGGGATSVAVTTFGGQSYTYLEGEQPMSGGYTLAHALVLVGDVGAAPAALALDGGGGDASTGESASFILYADGSSAFEPEAITFGPCAEAGWVHDVHTVEFEGGSVSFALDLGTDNILTAPSQLRSATGTLDGEAFAVEDFFSLFYRPGHHHYSRDFAVRFAAPIGEACALVVTDIDDQPGTVTAVVSVADCALTPLSGRTVLAETWSGD